VAVSKGEVLKQPQFRAAFSQSAILKKPHVRKNKTIRLLEEQWYEKTVEISPYMCMGYLHIPHP
jgi:hypothetical protein